mmetsp:Transcript_17363/g.37350  ORF Transcript_17363/g.37350 Transcript_17363/m.37350 type:complete len:223 (-) Transcript_17363:268-936(-)
MLLVMLPGYSDGVSTRLVKPLHLRGCELAPHRCECVHDAAERRALYWVSVHAGADERLERRRHAVRQAHRVVCQCGGDGGLQRRQARPRNLVRQQLEEHHRKRVDIGRGAVGLVPDHLRCHPSVRTHLSREHTSTSGALRHKRRQPKVDQFNSPRAVQEDVGPLEVPVYHFILVQVEHPRGDAGAHPQHEARRYGYLQRSVQVTAVAIFGDEAVGWRFDDRS